MKRKKYALKIIFRLLLILIILLNIVMFNDIIRLLKYYRLNVMRIIYILKNDSSFAKNIFINLSILIILVVVISFIRVIVKNIRKIK